MSNKKRCGLDYYIPIAQYRKRNWKSGVTNKTKITPLPPRTRVARSPKKQPHLLQPDHCPPLGQPCSVGVSGLNCPFRAYSKKKTTQNIHLPLSPPFVLSCQQCKSTTPLLVVLLSLDLSQIKWGDFLQPLQQYLGAYSSPLFPH